MIELVRVVGLCTVQDHGRIGRMHEGLPHGGALVRSLLARANRAAHNPDDTPAFELTGQLVVRATAALTIATDRSVHALAPGDELRVESEPRRVTYLAVRGGVAAPILLGSHSTHASAGLGAPLHAGARFAVGDVVPARAATALPDLEACAPIRVHAGPDHEAFAAGAFAALLGSYRISATSDRVGTRLAGPHLARTGTPERSRPLVRGAIEVPRDGQPIVLGPEHPTTGGYPVIGVIASADLDRFFATRLGGTVTFSDARAPAHRRA